MTVKLETHNFAVRKAEEYLKRIKELECALEFVVKHFVKEGECFTLPNGDCVGNNCMHTKIPEPCCTNTLGLPVPCKHRQND